MTLSVNKPRSWLWLRVALMGILAALVCVPASGSAALAPLATASSVPKPTIVLVHGAWADSSSWANVIGRLQRQGFTVNAFSNPLRGLGRDSADLASYLQTISGPVILVGHSYGGAVITDGGANNPKVNGLVYIDAFTPAQGETLEQLTFAKPGSCLAGGGDLSNVFDLVRNPSQRWCCSSNTRHPACAGTSSTQCESSPA